tara:strand:- start:346 stop:978 length:633 start_codon:yes stop_codon:yes gene_type:complete
MIEKNNITHTFLYYGVKRFLDIAFAIFLVILLCPLMILLIFLVIIFDGFPVFYAWRVHGIQGKQFIGYKFRTMHRFADKEKEKLEELNEMDGPVFKIAKDPRVTKFGYILRKFSLDELPQIYSVLKGDMSFIGPRPAGFNEFPNYEDWQYRKLSVVPGISCLWQVNGRNDIDSFDDWINLDLEYIDNWSLWLDIKIFFKTIIVVFMGSGK